MKKLITFILCLVVLVGATSFVAFAEEETSTPIVPNTEVSEDITEPEKPVTEVIVDYVKSHIEEFSVIGTLLATVFYEIRKHRKLNDSIGTLNNNAVTIAENSDSAIAKALLGVENTANVVVTYKNELEALLEEIRQSAEEKKSLEDTLKHIETFLKTVKMATLEMANEVAELLVLANIPNSKKDELYARHTKSVRELEAVEEEGNNDKQKA